MTIIATIEARMGSSRLPGKILMPAGGQPLLGILIDRLKRVPQLDRIVVATTIHSSDDAVVEVAQRYGAGVFRGSVDDVLDRVAGALAANNATVCVEITADCPLLDPALVSAMIDHYRASEGQHKYVANTTGPVPGAPNGQDIQVFAADILFAASAETRDLADREHVSLYLYRPENADRFRPKFIQQLPEAVARRIVVTLDYEEDYHLIRGAHESISDPYFGIEELVRFCDAHPELSLPCLARRGLNTKGFPLNI